MENSLLIDELSLSTQKAENWKSIPGYEGIYEASDLGRIRTARGKTTYSVRCGTRTWQQRILRPKYGRRKRGKNRDARVELYKDKHSKTLLVSRLVAMTWCPGYKQGMTVNHINGNTLDNSASNLEWVTLPENIKHGFRTGLYSFSEKTTLRNLTTGDTFVFDSMAKAGVGIGHSAGYISDCLKKNKLARDISGDVYEISVNSAF